MKNLEAQNKEPNLSQLDQKISQVFTQQMSYRLLMAKTSVEERRGKLKKMLALLESRKEDIGKALHADFRKNPTEAFLTELFPLIQEIKHTLKHLKKWMDPQKVKTPITLMGSDSSIIHEPKGVVLIISPWNYPFFLTFSPLIYALAAGNCVMIKPSEFTPHTSSLIKALLTELFEEKEVAVFEGDHQVASALLSRPFHHIFFTGSPEVGKVVMRAAANHLTSVTLELGGKSPVIIDESADIKEAAKKIAWGKFMNNGQTCIAPDYIFVHQKKEKEFLDYLAKQIQTFYGETEEERKKSPDYCRIVNDRHFKRVKALLDSAKEKGAQVVMGGVVDAEDRYIAPTLLSRVDLESEVMKQEIFGPLLPVLTYQSLDEVFSLINSKDKPLALYIYSQDQQAIEVILKNTSAGGTCVNHNILHISNLNLPFGGTNNSGIGKTNGIFGFKAFSNERALLRQNTKMSADQLMYPPYTNLVKKLIHFTMKWL